MFKRKKEPYVYRGNVCPPPFPQATAEELAQSSEKFSDIMDSIFDLFKKADDLMNEPVADAINNNRSHIAGWVVRFPGCGQQIVDELLNAKASIIEANKLAAVQGYAAQRRIRKPSNGIQ